MNATLAPTATVIALPARETPIDTTDLDGQLGELIPFPTPADVSNDLDADVPVTIPDGVWDEVDAAFARALDLELSGCHVRFERGAGRVRVEVLDDEGRVLRPLALREAVGFGNLIDDPPYAA